MPNRRDRKIGEITFGYSYSHSKFVAARRLSFEYRVSFLFERATYRVLTSGGPETHFEKPYDVQLTEDEIKLITDDQAKRHTQAIKSEIDRIERDKK